ncbi:MAG: quinolinate synthase NadA [Kiritimatiellae bacterium]|nr:quinolinate synthase NadA [Kiritimatiellia bacterium]MDD5522299.1 quinolinate synthase NadA [Kiritimatiellia bacterium]
MKEIVQEINDIRRQWGKKLLILGHHYQRPSVLCHADELGDSLELSRKAASHSEAERIVFCGVKFMAESADILTNRNQTVYMPDISAGCPMANMADADEMTESWKMLESHGGEWLPVVYVNSSAEIKACCGKWGGSTCTSSNASKVFKWVFAQGKKVFFLPDEHLGINTAYDMGIPDNEVLLYDPGKQNGGIRTEELARAKVIVWKGFCLVHVAFKPEHVIEARKKFPDAKIIVHPETPREVVRMCDAHGSTSQIIKYVEAAAAGSTIIVGTELNLVDRLAAEQKCRVTVKALSSSVCANMAKTNANNLLALLKEWPARNEVHVPESVAVDARKSLTTMLNL